MIRLTPPTRSGVVSSTWGKPRSYRDGWHGGLDFHDERGAPALAMAPGTVARVQLDAGGGGYAGKYVVIDHGQGIYTRLIHMDTVTVQHGQQVQRGQVIGTIGSTGTHSGSPHAHVDLKLSPVVLARYEQMFGKPTTGWYRDMPPWGRGAPMEPVMDGASYKAGTLESAMALGVKPFRRTLPVVMIAVAVAAAAYLLVR